MRQLAALALILALAVPAEADARERTAPAQDGRTLPRGYANPSAVVAAEIALARLTREQGQWMPDGGLRFFAWAWNGTSFDAVLNLAVAAPPPAGQ